MITKAARKLFSGLISSKQKTDECEIVGGENSVNNKLKNEQVHSNGNISSVIRDNNFIVNSCPANDTVINNPGGYRVNIPHSLAQFVASLTIGALLNNIFDQMSTNSTGSFKPKFNVLTGPIGSGKKQAILHCINTSQKKKYSNVIWVEATTYSTMSTSFQNAWHAIFRATQPMTKQIISNSHISWLVKAVYDYCGPHKTLIVFHNAVSYHGVDGIKDFLPRSLNEDNNMIDVIVTSHFQQWEHCKVHIMPELTIEESTEFLKQRLPFENSKEFQESAAEIYKIFNGFPMALNLISKFVEGKTKLYQATRRKFYTLKTFLSERKTSTYKKENTVETSIKKLLTPTYQKISKLPHAALCFQILTLLNEDSIPKDMLGSIVSDGNIISGKAITTLINYNILIDCGDYFRTRKIFKLLFKKSTDVKLDTSMKDVVNRFYRFLSRFKSQMQNAPLVLNNAADFVNSLRPHSKDQCVAKLVSLVAMLLEENGRWSEAQDFRKLLGKPILSKGKEPRPYGRKLPVSTLEVLSGMQSDVTHYHNPALSQSERMRQWEVDFMSARLWEIEGKLEKALLEYMTIFEEKKKILGPSHDSTLETEVYVGSVYEKLEKLSEAVETFWNVFRQSWKTKNEFRLKEAKTKLSLVLIKQENYKQLEELNEWLASPNQTDLMMDRGEDARSIFANVRSFFHI